jgi:hypothetical protein
VSEGARDIESRGAELKERTILFLSSASDMVSRALTAAGSFSLFSSSLDE